MKPKISMNAWESTIKIKVAQGLYRNRTIPPEIVKLVGLKLPMLMYLMSNVKLNTKEDAHK